MKFFSENIRRYAAICGILGSIIIVTKSYYALIAATEHTAKQISRLSVSLDKLDSNVDKLTIEVAVLKNIMNR